MATPTYTPIETYTLSTAASSVTFGSGNTLPQTYTDLVIVVQGIQESSYSARNMGIRFNNDSGSNYSSVQILNTSAGSDNDLNNAYGPLVNSSVNTTSGAYTTGIINIQNYSNSTTFKTVINKGGTSAVYTSGGSNVGTYIGENICVWRNTAPITQITLYAVAPNQAGSGSNWSVGSTFTLYGIANAAIGAPKATGGIITYDSTYYYHTFGASGTFTPQQSLTADILVVAGGGGGASVNSGGGGAGGLLGFASQSLTATGYTVTVGAGGAGGQPNLNNGSVGGDSQFASLTLVKGGGYGSAETKGNGGNGGSGGGGGAATSGGSPTSGQGYAGGNGYPSGGPTWGGGGGGGANQAGANGTSTGAGDGGDGSSTYSSWGLATGTGQNVSGTVYYAGGGGGGTRGSYTVGAGGDGGGGNGANDTLYGGTGKPNSGGGGGAGGWNGSTYGVGGAGGSGVVIIRYLKA